MNQSLDTIAGISKVSYYQSNPLSTCDRCSAAIKHVFIVTYRDGLKQKYGSECIHKILAQAPTLRKLFDKNVKLLQKHQRALEVLAMPYDQMPRGREYFGSGLYFIADSTGEDISADTHWFFHPVYDRERNIAGGRYVVRDEAEHLARCEREIADGKRWLAADTARIESFLAKVLTKIRREVKIDAVS